MKAFIASSFFAFFLWSNLAFAQYPSTNTLIADVKASNPKGFVMVTPTGNWTMFHDKVSKSNNPDACQHVVKISGGKNADGTYWSYKGLAIYNMVVSKMVFDRVFLYESETRLNGINFPENSFFLNTFKEKMNARDQKLMRGNPRLLDATNFYSYELKTDPRATGNSEHIFVFAIITVVFDSYPGGGTKLQKRESEIQLKFEKKENDFVFLSGTRSQGGKEILAETDFGSKDILKTIPTFETSGKSLEEMTSQKPSYPLPLGSNGEGYPKDQEILSMMEGTFLTKEDNFKVLFGEKGMNIITDVKFKVKDDEKAETTELNHLKKAFYCDYVFFNEKEEEKKLIQYTGRRVLEIQLEKDSEVWVIVGAKFLTETEYIKKTSLNWSSLINTVRANSYAKRVFGK